MLPENIKKLEEANITSEDIDIWETGTPNLISMEGAELGRYIIYQGVKNEELEAAQKANPEIKWFKEYLEAISPFGSQRRCKFEDR